MSRLGRDIVLLHWTGVIDIILIMTYYLLSEKNIGSHTKTRRKKTHISDIFVYMSTYRRKKEEERGLLYPSNPKMVSLKIIGRLCAAWSLGNDGLECGCFLSLLVHALGYCNPRGFALLKPATLIG